MTVLKKIKNLLGFEINFEFELPPKHELLRVKFTKYWQRSSSNEKTVLKSLKALPKGCFIALYLDDSKDLFVRFTKEDGWLALDFPAFGNGKEEDGAKNLTELFEKHGISRLDFIDKLLMDKNKRYVIRDYEDSDKAVFIYFRRNYRLATRVAFDIGGSIYKINNPQFISCEVGGN